MADKERVALVLSGGGAKGAYQAGVWRALRKMHIRYHLVTGTSVGALNAMFIVQRDYLKCMRLWRSVTFEHLYCDKFPDKHETFADMTKIYKKYVASFFKSGGMDTSKMEKIVYKLYNPRKFFSSPIDYGIITYNLTTRKEVAKCKKNMTKTSVPEYLIASASCYPAFKKKNINGENYVDGGYSDNLPINLAIEMGATSVIAVDLNAIGRTRKVKNADIPITYIEPRNNLSSFLVFDPGLSKRSIQYGYNDAMKVFHQLDGDYFTFKKNHLNICYLKYKDAWIGRLKEVLQAEQKDKSIYDNLLKLSIFHKLLARENSKQVRKVMDQTLEYLGKLFKVDDAKIYTYSSFHKELLKKLSSMDDLNIKVIESKLKEKDLKSFLNTALIIHYIYDRLQVLEQTKRNHFCRLAFWFPKEFIAALYLDVLEKE